ncbi:MAG: ribosomal protein S18-alanine N-acetyltransferase [Magnetococcus sp. YQC-9]
MTLQENGGCRLTDLVLSHVSAVAALELEIAPSPWSAGMLAAELILEGWRKVLLTSDQQLVGYLVARLLYDEWHLLTLGVAPDYRRRGLGRGLVAALLEEACLPPGREVLLEVRASNIAARSLYEGMGFTRIGLRRGYYRQGPYGPEDALVMACCSAR